MTASVACWLAQDGAHAKKHQRWLHPFITCLIHYLLVTVVCVASHDLLRHFFASDHNSTNNEQCTYKPPLGTTIPFLLLLYSCWLLLWRIAYVQPRIYANCMIYEFGWMCNTTLVVGAFALATQRPLLASAFCVTVGIDQLLWYLDLASYAIQGKCLVGVASYLWWPHQTWTQRITCTHHLWTIPLLLHAAGGLHFLALPLSGIVMTVHVCLSRWLVPHHVCYSKPKGGGGTVEEDDETTAAHLLVKYLNVNLGHELWKDITFDFLQINYDDPPVFLYIVRLLWRWQVLNTIVFGLLFGVCYFIYGVESVPVC